MSKQAELAKLQTAWLTAFRQQDPFVIACPSLATARNIRFRLYNAVKPIRDGIATANPELTEAVNSLQISVQETPPAVIVQRKLALDVLDAAFALAGVSLDGMQTAEEAEAAASLARVQALMQQADEAEESREARTERVLGLSPAPAAPAEPVDIAPKIVANPFFTRSDTPGMSK